MTSHAMLPIADHICGNIFRIYFSGRDKNNRSLIGFSQLDITNPKKNQIFSKEPVLSLGELGCFDDNGVTPSWIVNYNNKKNLYYIGWNKGSTVRYSLIAGLAISENNGASFRRNSRGPLLERTNLEPISILTSPCVLKDDCTWKMWYTSGIKWMTEDLPQYNIKYAESSDGITWKRNGIVCIDFENKEETSISRPCVLKEDGIYKMWYSYKRNVYKIGYAESSDGIKWIRKDHEVGIDVSESGWDSEMMAYPYVFFHQGNKYMLYNGNDYGRDGIGLAIMEE